MKEQLSVNYNLPKDEVAKTGKLGDLVDHHLYSVSSLSELSIDTLGTFSEDEWGIRYICPIP